jgi:ribosomal protein L7Ae-like RNA K-turn-binding protein
LGQATGLNVGSAAASIVEAGDAAELVKEIATKVDALKKGATV